MRIKPISTRKINPPKDNIFDILDTSCTEIKEKDVILITSKILAIHQGLCIKMYTIKNKDDLIKKEADVFIPRDECPNRHAILTIKDNILIPSAGIDESNSNGYYVLWPKNSAEEAEKICKYLKKKFNIKDLAVIITDSHTIPMRYGVMGISIGFYGLQPLKSYIDKKDIFGRKIKMTKSNIADTLSAIGVCAMGEGDEQTPIVIISDANFVEFTNKPTYQDLIIPPNQDIYYPLISRFYKQN